MDSVLRWSGIRVYVYPAFNARYYSLYIEGLRRLVGASHLKYTTTGFPEFGTDCLAIRVVGTSESRIFIHSNDSPELDRAGLAWSDVFGKVNLDPALVPEDYRSKVFALGPTFAVRVWGPVAAEATAVRNYVSSQRVCDFRQHLANYRGQYRSRFPERTYRPGLSRKDYVFFNAALWEREPEANALRARFVDACRSLRGIRFEGGLSPRHSARGIRGFGSVGYERYLCRRYTAREYLENTRKSAVVLNNPAYRECHSWRLAEYLALGKAIISTCIVRALPAPLLHGTHVHYVDGSADSLRSAILQICGDDRYRKTLEENARGYYEAYLSPSSVMRRILARAEVDVPRPLLVPGECGGWVPEGERSS